MFVLGITTLGCLNQPAHSRDNLGLGFWRVVIAAGILNMILGFFNLIAVSYRPAIWAGLKSPLLDLKHPHHNEFTQRN